MTVKIIPMFPLGTALLPGGVLPLHIFEPRYREMVRSCLQGDREFGVVLISRGSEVGGGDQRNDVGTVARMVQVAELADGRFAMITVGMSRFRVITWLADDPYPQALVEDWLDEDLPGASIGESLGSDVAGPLGATIARLPAVTARVRRLVALAVELGDSADDPSQELSDDPVAAVFQLATLAPLSVADRYTLLALPGVVARIAALEVFLDDVEAALTFRLHAGTPSGDPPASW